MKTTYPTIPGTVIIAHDIHATSQDGLDRALDFLATDYDVKNCMEGERPHRGYFATLKESVFQNMTRCDFCQHLNVQLACKVHGYSCQGCGKVLYREYVKGGTIKFSFRNDEKMRYITLYIHSYENDRIICYPKPMKDERSIFSTKDPKALLEQFKDEYEVVTIDGKQLLSFFYPAKWKNVDRTINMAEVRGAPQIRRQHYQSVAVYKGQVFEDRYEMGIKDSFMIYDTFKDAPFKDTGRLHAKIMSMAGQVSRCDYYYQDRRSAFSETQFGWMKTAVETFTDLPKEEFAEFLRTCRQDGPGFICMLAQFVEKHTGVKQQIENNPNIGNILNAMCHDENEDRFGEYFLDDELGMISKIGKMMMNGKIYTKGKKKSGYDSNQ